MTPVFTPPTHCPSCQRPLVLSATGIDLFCPNSQGCQAQVLARLSYFCQRNLANINGLSEKQLAKFIQEFGIKEVSDLYDLPWEKIVQLEGFQAKSVQNLQKAIENAKKISDYKFLAGLSIEGVGPEVAKLICQIL